jgi:LysR family glycine cleavage system transcriptional activator
MSDGFRSIRTFVAVARARSFTAAAAQLHVSQGAVSQQIARLEHRLGVELFERTPGGLTLTDRGRRLYVAVADSTDRIDEAVARVRADAHEGEIALTALAAFTANWLLPRLGDFERRHPGLRLRCETTTAIDDLASRGIDLGIRYGSGNWPGLTSELLFDDRLIAVARPEVGASLDLAAGPAALRAARLLYDLDGPGEWAQWFDAAGLDPTFEPAHGFSDMLVLLAALRYERRVALMRHSVAQAELQAGTLVTLFDLATPTRGASYLVYPSGIPLNESVRALRAWLGDQAREYVDARDVRTLLANG